MLKLAEGEVIAGFDVYIQLCLQRARREGLISNSNSPTDVAILGTHKLGVSYSTSLSPNRKVLSAVLCINRRLQSTFHTYPTRMRAQSIHHSSIARAIHHALGRTRPSDQIPHPSREA